MAKLELDLATVNCSELRGHFLTCPEAARHAGVSPDELRSEPDAVRIAGAVSLEEVYPDWQFDRDGGFVHGLRGVVRQLRSRMPGRLLAAYLTAPLPQLGGACMVDWIAADTKHEPIEIVAR